MDEIYIARVMLNVFQYLKSPDLAIAAQVSSMWDLLARYEKLERNSNYFIFHKIIKNFILRFTLKNMTIQARFNFTPSFGIRFYNSNVDINVSHECDCRNRQFCGFIVNLKSNWDMEGSENTSFLYWFLFPINDLSDVTVLSFINRRIAYKNNHLSIAFDENDSEKTNFILYNLDRFFSEEDIRSKFLIIFCRSAKYRKLLKFCQSLEAWFGDVDVALWIAMVDEISFCRYNLGHHDCRIDTEFIFMFITNPSLKSYTHFMSENCTTVAKIIRELTKFRKRVVLSLHSIAFMHISYIRIDRELYELDISTFKQVFPTVDLFPFYGTGSFVGSDFFELLMQPSWPNVFRIYERTSILLITHD